MEDFSEAQKLFMNELFTKLTATINEKTSEIRTEINTQLEEIKESYSNTSANLQERINFLEKENKTLKNNIINLERKIRKNNILIFGLDPETEDIWQTIINIFTNTLEIHITEKDLNDVYWLKSKTNNKKLPVVVEFISYQQKSLVLRNAKKLKGGNISIAKDQCPEDRLNTKELLSHQKEARKSGKTAYLRGGKLMIENEIYTLEQLQNAKEESETEIEIVEKSDSAPPTPQPISRQKRLLEEIGTGDETLIKKPNQGSSKKAKTEMKKIQTRSTTVVPNIKKS